MKEVASSEKVAALLDSNSKKLTRQEKSTSALTYLIATLFEAKSLDNCLDVAIEGLSTLGFFQSQISLREDGYFVVKRNHMDKKWQFLLERIGRRKFSGQKIDIRTPFVAHLLDGKMVTTVDIKDAAKVKLEDIIEGFLPREWTKNKRFEMVKRVASVIPKKIDLLIIPLNYQGKIIGAVGFSSTSLERDDALFLRNVCELLAQAFERVQTREGLKKSEEKLRSIFASCPDAIIVSDLNANIIDCNQATLDMGGFSSKDEIVGENALELIARKDHKKAMEHLKKTLEQGSVKNIEYTFLARDGHEYPGELSASVIKDSSGNPTGFVAITKDITERKKTEEALSNSEEKYRNLVEQMPDVIYSLDAAGNITSVNKASKAIFGLDPEEITGRNFAQFTAKEALSQSMADFKQVRTGKEITAESAMIDKDGKQHIVEFTSAPIIKDGEVVGSQGIVRDITERKKAEEELRFLKEFSERVIDSLADALLVIDSNDYTIISVNEAALKQLELRKEDLVGKTCYETTHHRSTPCKPPHDICPIQKMLKTGKAITVEHTHFDKDNNEIYVEVSAHPVRSQEGKITQAVCISRDVTERNKAEARIRSSEERYRNLVELAPDSIMTFDLKGVITSCNTASTRLSGYSKNELVGKHFSRAGVLRARDIPKYLKMLPYTVRGKVPKPFEVIWQHKNGTSHLGEVRLSLTREKGKIAGIQAIMRDITERKRMEDELRRYSDHLEELVEERTRGLKESQEQVIKSERLATIGEIATMVAHDLRNPLTSIRNASYYIRNSCPSHAEPECKTAIEMLNIIEQETIFANKIVSDLLDFSAPTSLQRKRQNINKLIEDSLTEISIPENVKIKRKLDKRANATIDGKQLQRVFLNLTKNAVQAMPRGGKLTIKTKDTKDHIEITFTDTGVGIPEENMSKIFTPLFTTKAKGIGMGLPICQKIVVQHTGTINVKSEVGKGTTFTIRLPKKGGRK